MHIASYKWTYTRHAPFLSYAFHTFHCPLDHANLSAPWQALGSRGAALVVGHEDDAVEEQERQYDRGAQDRPPKARPVVVLVVLEPRDAFARQHICA